MNFELRTNGLTHTNEQQHCHDGVSTPKFSSRIFWTDFVYVIILKNSIPASQHAIVCIVRSGIYYFLLGVNTYWRCQDYTKGKGVKYNLNYTILQFLLGFLGFN